MSETIPIGATRSIRDCGFDEVWLQDQIADNPNCLQLGSGELELVSRERQQAGGGRLDILLKNPDDDSMYEVEVMLGETDEKHIIHTIEYWDRENQVAATPTFCGAGCGVHHEAVFQRYSTPESLHTHHRSAS